MGTSRIDLSVDSLLQNGGGKRKRQKPYAFKKRKKTQAVPTAEELNALREAETMFHLNLFKMQVEELMKELKDKMQEKDFMLWLQNFKELLLEIPESSPSSLDEFTLGDSVKVPILVTPESNKGSFKFVPPSAIKEIGSFALGTTCSSTPIVDIALEIPKTCWQGMDFLNQRYLKKRAFYLAYVAHELLQLEIISDMKFTYQDDCYLKPVLLITPADVTNFTVCLTAYPSQEAFKVSRFVPSRNNVRSSWFLKTNEDSDQGTPNYNSLILSDLMLPVLDEYIKENIPSHNIKDAIILLKLWSFKRGLTTGHGRLNGFLLTAFIVHLIKTKKIDAIMSSYQVFRCCLLALRSGALTEGITLCNENKDVSVEFFQKIHNVVLIDPTGCFNLCYNVSKETALMVQHEATIGLQILDTESPDNFSNLFMNKISFNSKFEYLLHLKGPKKFKKYVKKLGLVHETLDFGENQLPILIPKVCELLRKGLTNRVLLLDVSKPSHTSWPVSESPPNPNAGWVTFGFLLNPAVPLNNLEKGPVADDPKAKEFRDFWGKKSELRRFQDGTIREAVFWPASTTADRRSVFFDIVKDILARHLDATQNIVLNGTEIDCILQVPDTMFLPDFPPYGTGEETFEGLMQTFHSLTKQMRSLNGLPLMIASIQGSSPAFRFTDVFPPIPSLHETDTNKCWVSGHMMKFKDKSFGIPPYTPALKAIITLEGSGKWPDDIEAIRRVKAAFHIKIAQLVKSQCSLLAVPFITHTDIYKDGFLFRFEVASHKEIFLMKQTQTESGSIQIRETKESQDLEMSTETIPKLNSVLHGLQQQHNTYGTACRLAKRWISSQLKHSFLHDITIELIVAFIYIHPEPYTCPSSPQVAFIRFLNLLISHDWMTFPLIVNLNDELKKEEIEGIYSSFTSQRSSLPSMVVITPFDKRGAKWTKNMPPAMILKRISILAQASLKTMDGILSNKQAADIKCIFRPPLESFDVLIYLKRDEIPRLGNAVDLFTTDPLPLYRPYKSDMNEVYPIVDYDPVEKYLKELRENFGEFAFFLYDVYGGDFIAAVWKKSSFVPKEFKASHVNCRTLCQIGTKVIPDVERILEDFFVLGAGIVKRVVKQTENWQLP